MKKRLLALAVPGLLAVAGCSAGPGYLHRTWDDTWNKNYGEQPLITSVLSSVVPVYPFVEWVAMIPDFLVLNTVQFWGYDVWDGKGAMFIHDNPKETKATWYGR